MTAESILGALGPILVPIAIIVVALLLSGVGKEFVRMLGASSESRTSVDLQRAQNEAEKTKAQVIWTGQGINPASANLTMEFQGPKTGPRGAEVIENVFIPVKPIPPARYVYATPIQPNPPPEELTAGSRGRRRLG